MTKQKTPARKAVAKSTAKKKTAAAAGKKSPARKATKKVPVKKASAKKSVVKKTSDKKAAKKKPLVKKAVAKKPAKKAGATAAPKSAAKKSSGRKPAAPKAARPAAAKKTAAKPKNAAKKKIAPKKKITLKKQSSAAKTPSPAKKSQAKTTAAKSKARTSKRSDQVVKEAAKKVGRKDTGGEKKGSGSKEPPRRKSPDKRGDGKKKSSRNIAFSLDEALEIANQSESNGNRGNGNTSARKPSRGASNGKRIVNDEITSDNSVHGAASIADILGYNPDSGAQPPSEIDRIPKKYHRYYKLLIELRDHVVSELDLHTKDTLKRSAKEDSGNLSSYSQHLADAGTDTFDRDFALSLVSSEQEALYEIEEAIQRIKSDTYGVCEMTGKPIKKERLLAVPFARFSLEGQVEYERTHRKSTQRGGAFAESGEETVKFLEDEGDE